MVRDARFDSALQHAIGIQMDILPTMPMARVHLIVAGSEFKPTTSALSHPHRPQDPLALGFALGRMPPEVLPSLLVFSQCLLSMHLRPELLELLLVMSLGTCTACRAEAAATSAQLMLLFQQDSCRPL